MKLALIAETGLRGKMVITKTADALGTFIQYVYNNGSPEHQQALDKFLTSPTARNWEDTKWLIDAITKLAINDKTITDDLETWNELKTITSPVVAAAVYDIDRIYARGTSLQRLSLSKSTRDKYKLAMGPQGYIGAMSNASDIGTNKLRDMLRATAQSGAATAKAAKKDMPSIKPVNRF